MLAGSRRGRANPAGHGVRTFEQYANFPRRRFHRRQDGHGRRGLDKRAQLLVRGFGPTKYTPGAPEYVGRGHHPWWVRRPGGRAGGPDILDYLYANPVQPLTRPDRLRFVFDGGAGNHVIGSSEDGLKARHDPMWSRMRIGKTPMRSR